MTQTDPLHELSRLRDILYGEYARSTEENLGHLRQHVENVRQELIDLIERRHREQTNNLEINQQQVKQRINTLENDQSNALADAHEELTERINQLEAAADHDRRQRQYQLGLLLSQLGQHLQADSGLAPSDSEE
ncbi:MAG TPA: hypothetical protein VLL52_03420 [Anaerolineae bacterium]|nr:hypothetical protein [Anaerolineae bacterium]